MLHISIILKVYVADFFYSSGRLAIGGACSRGFHKSIPLDQFLRREFAYRSNVTVPEDVSNSKRASDSVDKRFSSSAIRERGSGSG